MNKNLTLLILSFILFQQKLFSADTPKSAEQFSNHHLINGFIENKGQEKNKDVLCSSSCKGLKLFITTHGITYVLNKKVKSKNEREKWIDSLVRIDVNFLQAQISKAQIIFEKKKNDASINFFNAENPKGIFGLQEYEKVIVKNIYPNIDWVVIATDSSLKYNFEIVANADYSKLKLQYNGVESLKLGVDGSLHVHSKIGDIIESQPVSFQANKKIKSIFKIESNNTVSFSVNKIQPHQAFTIDPNIVWTTLFGGSGNDELTAVATDASNNFFVTGNSSSTNFPIKNAGTYYVSSNQGGKDVVISKFSASQHLLWSTYFGGVNDDIGRAIKTDNGGNVFVTGYTTSSNFPIQNSAGAYFNSLINQNSGSGWNDAFLLKFNNNGNMIWSTFIGGSGDDLAEDLSVDYTGNVFVVGSTMSSNFPTISGSGFNQTTINGVQNGFIEKFSNTGAMLWSSYFGGNSSDVIYTVSNDLNGNIFIGGSTNSSASFPLQNNGTFYQSTLTGTEGFVAKFSSSLNLNWSSFYGGNGVDFIQSSVADYAGSVYFAGTTTSSNFPTYATGGAFLKSTINSSDVFILKFDNGGTRKWATLFGGNNLDDLSQLNSNEPQNDALLVDNCGNVYLSFQTNSNNLPVKIGACNSYYDATLTGGSDAFIAKFSKKNELTWATYWGGNSSENPLAMCFDSKFNLLCASSSFSNFGINFLQSYPFAYIQSFITTLYSLQNGCLIKINQPTFDAHANYALCGNGCIGAANIIVNSVCDSSAFNYHWNNGLNSSSANLLCSGNYSVIVTDTAWGCGSDTVTFNLQNGIKISPNISGYSCSYKCNASATASLPNNISGVNFQWHVNDTVYTNLSSINHLCPHQDTLITSVTGCGSDTEIFRINIPPLLTIFVNNLIQPNILPCPIQCNGSAEVVLIGGAAQATNCIWSNGVVGTVINNLCPGQTYTVHSSDSSCYSALASIVTNTPLTEFSQISSTSLCGNFYQLFANMYNTNSSHFTYLWSNGNTSSTITNISPGTYWCKISDSCVTDSVSITVYANTQPLSISLTEIIAPCDSFSCSGQVQLNVYGGIGAGQVIWSNGNTNNSILTNLCPDSIIWVQVTDACGNIASDTIKVVPNYSPVHAGIGYTPSCAGICNGTVYCFPAYGGNPPFQYQWKNGAYQSTLLNVCYDSTYFCIITDACGSRDSIFQKIPLASPVIGYTTLLGVGCSNNCNSVATVSAYGGVAPYNYLWSNGSGLQTAIGLCPDSTYSCIITSPGCSSDTTTITMPHAPTFQAYVTFSDSACGSNCNGIAIVGVSGGFPPFYYNWSNGATSYYTSNLCAGNNLCIVTDSCGNVAYLNVYIPNATTKLHANILNSYNSCINLCNGKSTVHATGGRLPYHYQWSNGSTASSVQNLCAGNNFCIVSDACYQSDTIYFTTSSYSSITSSISSTDSSCINNCNGSASIQVVGGKQPYKFLWNNNDSTASVNNLCIGLSYCIVTDECHSRDSLPVYVSSVNHLGITNQIVSNSCMNLCSGKICINLNGGKQPYRFAWSNGKTGQQIDSLCTGVYSVVISNHFCLNDTLFDTIHINSNILQSTTKATNVMCYDSCTGVGNVFISGGIQPYYISWSNGLTTTQGNSLCAGTYSITITDSIGCIVHDTISIKQPSPLYIDTTLYNAHCYQADGIIVVQAHGGVQPYSYHWNNGANLNSTQNLFAGNYTVKIIDSNLCPSVFSFYLPEKFCYINLNNDTTIGAGQSVQLQVSGATNYVWSPSTNLSCDSCGNPIWNGLQTQQYCVIGTDNWGCTDTACVKITTFDDCQQVLTPTAFSPNNDGLDDILKPIYPKPDCFVSEYFRVYDRWGTLLFETTDFSKGWDGSYKNKPMPIDTYVWYLDATNFFGKKLFFKGDVILVK